jgi:hypothetical protein
MPTLYPGIPALRVPPITVPSLSTAIGAAAAANSVSSAAPPKPTWGIYQLGSLAVEPDTIVAFEYKAESRISDYPQEEGAFQSYNKVAVPWDARLELAKGGSDADRALFISQIETIADPANTTLYDVVMPERTYVGCSVQRYDFRRTAHQGVKLLVVDIWLKQVRNNATATFASTAAPSGQDKKNIGAVQPQTPTAAQKAKAGTVLLPPQESPPTNPFTDEHAVDPLGNVIY